MNTPEVSFGVMADCQWRDANDETFLVRGTDQRYSNNYRLSPQKLREAVVAFNKFDLDFIVHLGDFVDQRLEDADLLHSITGRANAPLRHVIGNHEFWIPGTTVEDVVSSYSMPSQYYSERINGQRLVYLDTCDLGILEHEEGSPEWKIGRALLDKMELEGAINAFFWNGGLGERQTEWLDAELTDAGKHDEEAILFAHHPVFPPGVLNALNSDEMLNLIDSHDNVRAFINGHNHGGAFGVRRGVPYVTMPGMLSGPYNAYGVADVYKDRLEIKGFGRVLDMVIEKS